MEENVKYISVRFETISKIMDIDRQRIGEEITIISHFIEYGIRLD